MELYVSIIPLLIYEGTLGELETYSCSILKSYIKLYLNSKAPNTIDYFANTVDPDEPSHLDLVFAL